MSQPHHNHSNNPEIPGEPWRSICQAIIESVLRQAANTHLTQHERQRLAAAETARVVAGWSDPNQQAPTPTSTEGFHEGFIRNKDDRRETHQRIASLIRDLVAALDRTCGVGSVVVHMQGETSPQYATQHAEAAVNSNSIIRNVSILASDTISRNPALAAYVPQLEDAVRRELGVMFVRDWRGRAVASGYISPNATLLEPVLPPVSFERPPKLSISPGPSPSLAAAPRSTVPSPSRLPFIPPPMMQRGSSPARSDAGPNGSQNSANFDSHDRSNREGPTARSAAGSVAGRSTSQNSGSAPPSAGGLSSNPSGSPFSMASLGISPSVGMFPPPLRRPPPPTRGRAPASYRNYEQHLPTEGADEEETLPNPIRYPRVSVEEQTTHTSRILPEPLLQLLTDLQVTDHTIPILESIYQSIGRVYRENEVLRLGFSPGTAKAIVSLLDFSDKV
ncbi:hypothetical protein BV25DRAFT_1922017 [Artomyces pyxidatus]|uniref:Uncharacterized protein n=1 Tax=Artomyces pyxidatus TaxID=48021 RepID=A0ACB8SFF1_9AGAM|nr:hypothetical protein BV25DRAFT_1922017 [Artomyces pyxidatus]